MASSAHPLIPGNDADRLLTLHRYGILGTAPEGLFDKFAALTAKLFSTPIALISLVAEDSIWFKAHFGLPDAGPVPRAQSLCSVAILHDEATIFDDLHARPCGLVEPELLQELELRFYAGSPLRTSDGFNIGTLCVIDRQARTLSPDEQALLGQLTVTVLLLLELRRTGVSLLEMTGPVWAQPYLTVPALVHQLALLAEMGSTGAAVDARGSDVAIPAIHREASRVAGLINQTISTALAG